MYKILTKSNKICFWEHLKKVQKMDNIKLKGQMFK